MQKTALVTGSSKGIGQAIAIRLSKDGYHVYVTYHTDREGGQKTVDEITKIGGSATLVDLDVSSKDSVRETMAKIKNDYGYLNVLVNNAERDIAKNIEDSTFAEWKMAFDSKVHGAWLCTKYALPLLSKADNPNVVMVSSSADESPTPEILSYAVATAALNSMVKALAIHLPRYGIRVNAVMPGQTRTANWGELVHDDRLWQKFAAQNPMKRVATPPEIADAVLTLINDPHRFLNGNFLFVNGGSHLK